MKNFQKGSVNVYLAVVAIIVAVIAGFAFTQKPVEVIEHEIKQPAPAVSAIVTPSILVTAPNGNEKLSQDTTYTVTWSYAGLDANDSVTVGFRTVNENVCWVGKTIVSAKKYSFVPGLVTCTGSVGSLKTGGQFKAQVIVDKYTEGRGVADTSNAYFTISPHEKVRLIAFEDAVNNKDYAEAQKYFADKVYLLLEGSECCGDDTAQRAANMLKSNFQTTQVTFDQNGTLVREYLASQKKDYPSGRDFGKGITLADMTIGVANTSTLERMAVMAYYVQNGRITAFFVSPKPQF